MTFADQILQFYAGLTPPTGLPDGVEVLDPYSDPGVRRGMETFYRRFYDDREPRVFVLGINPGRFGAGVTGIPFTDPLAMTEELGIDHDLGTGTELSARFVYRAIGRMGGPERFYRRVYITAMSPYGFVRNGKNLNYYDDADLEARLQPYMETALRAQLTFGATSRAVVFGTGKNMKAARALNDRLGLFDELLPLEHPRYVMQYKRKQLDRYLDKYAATFARAQEDLR